MLVFAGLALIMFMVAVTGIGFEFVLKIWRPKYRDIFLIAEWCLYRPTVFSASHPIPPGRGIEVHKVLGGIHSQHPTDPRYILDYTTSCSVYKVGGRRSKDLVFVAVPRPQGKVGLPRKSSGTPPTRGPGARRSAACNSNRRSASRPMAGVPSRRQPMGARHSPPPANRLGGRSLE